MGHTLPVRRARSSDRPRAAARSPGWPGRFRISKANLIGAGNEGSVYRLDAGRCIKIGRDRSALRKEVAVMRRGQPCPHFPRLHEWGHEYMVREYIAGEHLSRHLDENPLTREIARELISILVWLRRLGFRRIDMRLHHVIYSKGRLFIIDPANLNKEDDPFPRKIWRSLQERGHGSAFRAYLAELAPSLYDEWKQKLS
jgi:hypothetical protein